MKKRTGVQASKYSYNQLLPWMWAVNEHVTTYYTHFDRDWVIEAQNGWGESNFYKFLNEYMIFNNSFAKDIFGHGIGTAQSERTRPVEARLKFIEICNRYYRDSRSFSSTTKKERLNIQHQWEKVTDELNEWICRNRKESILKGNTLRLFSATAKAFWFYQPTVAPMFDQRVEKQLKREKYPIKRNSFNTPCDFVESFYGFHKQTSDIRKEARATIKKCKPDLQKPPYDIRITDKYLWLIYEKKSNPDRYKQKLKEFKKSLS